MALSKLAVRRLMKLADYMDSMPPEADHHFNMLSFFRHAGDHEHDTQDPKEYLSQCGTAACAAGWAATMPFFKRLGMGMKDESLAIDGRRIGIDEPEFLKIFGGISETESDELFSSSLRHTIRTPKQWAKHCRKFIRENS